VFETDATFGGDLWGQYGRSIRSLPALKLDPLQLRTVDMHLDRGEHSEAEALISAVERIDPFDWRVAWYRGKSLLAQGRPQDSLREFDVVLGELPGEVAPKLAIGLGYELSGDAKDALVYYDSVSRTDPLCTAAAFGLARAHLLEGDRAGAAAALERVSASSVRYAQAQLAMAIVLADDAQQSSSLDDLQRAAQVIDGLKGLVDGLPAHKVAADFFQVAAEVFENGLKPASTQQLLGVAANPAALRGAAERELRACARYAPDRGARVEFVDRANRVRPRTMW
jgi:serine/threonine-protein kinase PknG